MKYITAAFIMLHFTSYALAQASITISMHHADATAKEAGTVIVTESPYGLVFTPHLKGLQSGIHGFHVHENPSCAASEKDGKTIEAGAAGGHYDPHKTGKHDFPWGDGHLGDLPALFVTDEGFAHYPVLAPRIKKLSDIRGRSLMVHAGGDNHSDHPEPLGGGGARMICGVIEME